MKAWVFDRYGKDAALRAADLPAPVAGAGQVVVAVAAMALNVLDLKVRDGDLKAILPHGMPMVPGHDLAGTILSCGPGVTGWAPGDAVIACTGARNPGALAEQMAVDATCLSHAPKGIGASEAAGLSLAALTAWQALVDLGALKPGQKVFIQAGSGGVGSIAIQLARHLGAHVATTCSAANADLVRALGADEVVDYRTQDFSAVLSGYDLVLHSQDKASLDAGLRILKPGGLMVSLTGAPDPEFARDYGPNALFRLIVRLIGAGVRRRARKLGVRYRFLFVTPEGAELEQVVQLVESGAIRPVTDSRFPFAQADKALARLAGGRARGKVVVEVAGA